MSLALRFLLLVLVPVAIVTGAAIAGVSLPALAASALVAIGVAAFLAWRIAGELAAPLLALGRAAAAFREDIVIDVSSTGTTECDAAIEALADAAAALRERQDARDHEQGPAREQGMAALQRLQVVGRLGASIAHDFNNVLGVISNSLLLLRRLPSVEAHQMPLGALDRAAANGTRLVRHLQRLARPSSGASGAVDLRAFLDEAGEVLKVVVGSSVKVVVEVDAGLPPVRIDAAELELALVNLALNAREAMPAGGSLALRARLARADERPEGLAVAGVDGGTRHDAWVLLSAEDTGEGIAPAQADRVFERFHTTRPGHAGLGLAQVREACRAAGGEARLAAGATGGAQVLLLLPARVPPGAGDTADRADSSASRGGRDRLLLVEDNASLAQVTEALLALEGYEVVLAHSAAEAFERVAQAGADAFDVVLSDVVMPGGMDGLELARRLRERHPALPIVLISGYSSSLAGASDFEMLYKPYAPQDLARLLRKALGEARASKAA